MEAWELFFQFKHHLDIILALLVNFLFLRLRVLFLISLPTNYIVVSVDKSYGVIINMNYMKNHFFRDYPVFCSWSTNNSLPLIFDFSFFL